MNKLEHSQENKKPVELTQEQSEALLFWLKDRRKDIQDGEEDLGALQPLLSLLEKHE